MTFAPLLAADGLYVLPVKTPETLLRDSARQIVRRALGDALTKILAAKDGSIELLSSPGQPIRLAPPWSHIGISVSHEPGLSLAAVHLGGPVGIDLMRLGAPIADIELLAHDYLGPAAAMAIGTQPAETRQLAFANAWTRLEARLKCLALPLNEWAPELETQLATCTVTELAMPSGWIAAVATGPTSTQWAELQHL